MGIQRQTKANEGVEKYFINGKASMGLHRDEYDNRVPLGGNLNALKSASDFIAKYKGWESSYRHFSLSFCALDHAELLKLDAPDRTKKLTDMAEEMLSLYFPHRDKKDLIFYAEAHEPINGYKARSRRTKKDEARLLHFHLVVSNLDPVTGNKLEQISTNVDVLNAIQSEVCTNHGLRDPAYFVENFKSFKKGFSVRDKLGKALLDSKAESPFEVKQALLNTGLVEDVSLSFTRKNGLKIVTTINKEARYKNQKRINLTGDDFNALLAPLYNKYRPAFDAASGDSDSVKILKGSFFDNKERVNIYNSKNEQAITKRFIKKLNKGDLLSSSQEGRYRIASDKQLRATILDEAKGKFFERESVVYDSKTDEYLKQKNLANEHYFEGFVQTHKSKNFINEYGDTFDDLTRAQKNFYAIYKKSIDKKVIKDTKIFDDKYKPNTHVIFTKSLGLRIIDHKDDDCLSVYGYQDIQDKESAVRIMLETAIAKGWRLEDIEITGSDEFMSSVEKMRTQLISERDSSIIDKPSPPKSKPTSSSKGTRAPNESSITAIASQLSYLEKAARADINKRNKAVIQNKEVLKLAKEKLNEDRIKRLIISTNLNINIDNLEFSSNDKGHVLIQSELNSKKLNIVDYLMKIHGISLNRVVQLSKGELAKSGYVSNEDLTQLLTPPFSKKDKSKKEIYVSGLQSLFKEKTPAERESLIIKHILTDICKREAVEPILKKGRTKNSIEEVKKQTLSLLSERLALIDAYLEFEAAASLSPTIGETFDSKQFVQSNFESKLDGENVSSGIDYISDCFSYFYIKQAQIKNEKGLSDSDARIEMVTDIDYIPTFSELISSANEKVKNGYTKREDLDISQYQTSILDEVSPIEDTPPSAPQEVVSQKNMNEVNGASRKKPLLEVEKLNKFGPFQPLTLNPY